ncbi:MAG TPA: hypothetical protein O0X70_06055 [Methanocorpusculum sp.]|nr:hypothetical protein [Methanocorpusculum sp.]
MPSLTGMTASLGLFGMHAGVRGLDFSNPLSWIILGVVAAITVYVIWWFFRRKKPLPDYTQE